MRAFALTSENSNRCRAAKRRTDCMARKTHSRLKIEGTLTALTPMHVGGYGDSPDTDVPLARNGEDKCYVPGTSLAGVLRAWCVKACGESSVNEPRGFQKDDNGHSTLVV